MSPRRSPGSSQPSRLTRDNDLEKDKRRRGPGGEGLARRRRLRPVRSPHKSGTATKVALEDGLTPARESRLQSPKESFDGSTESFGGSTPEDASESASPQ